MHALTLSRSAFAPAASLRRPVPEIRLLPFVFPLFLRPVLRRATQIGMGAGLGIALGAICGNPVFWVGLGVALGVALGAVAVAPRPASAIKPGVYRIPQA